MTFLLAVSLLIMPLAIPSDAVVGPAQFYSGWYDRGGWEEIVDFRKDWGQLPADFALSEGEYFCADPDHDFGTRLRIENAVTGTVIFCRIVDRVAPADVWHWKQYAVIELSWLGFHAVNADELNRVIVTRDG